MNQIQAFIIEDQRDNIVLFRDVLQLANCNVENASDGRAALEWLNTHDAPQLIILDMNLPYITGLEIYRYVRQQAQFSETQIIATTANIPMADLLEKELVGGDCIMHKPVNVMEILKIARELSAHIAIR